MFGEIFKKRITVTEAMETVERLKLQESYHWSKMAHHLRVHDKIAKRRTAAESRLRDAEKAFIKATIEKE